MVLGVPGRARQPFEEFEELRHEGKLQRKRARRLFAPEWVDEWFAVTAEYLVSFASRTSGQVRTCVALAAVMAVTPCPSKNTFRIRYALHLGHSNCDASQELVLRAAEAHEVEHWISTINKAQDLRRCDKTFVPLSSARTRVLETEQRLAELSDMSDELCRKAEEAEAARAKGTALLRAAALAAPLAALRRDGLQAGFARLATHTAVARAQDQAELEIESAAEEAAAVASAGK
mmetsp:Transcript_92814/g.262742  ORF Transcript_92814/g.262742 Transcript_92814/m.262742 type:complete len:233 (-) Transcript_92814:3-701(-)